MLRTLYDYVSFILTGIFSFAMLLLAGLLLGYILGRWALVPMVALVLLIVGLWVLRESLLGDEPDL